MTCPKCLADDCLVAERLDAYRRDPLAFKPLQNAMLACAVASSYRRLGAATPQPVTYEMLREIARQHELRAQR